ncbi:vitamin K epoxide reductase [Candidatus Kaiserbacteria bacterium CG10_big_fil_rev_8_21_14_0_10_49_17]|uniref:Vitamin K epoxide reductase n=1 Tax=Candidatus Kaiserbacteria bacterium CG10_big_fil_rev_8_21_14_0_10_49_17 TaxID=1974609 RepID=A0A2M6WEN5_9BACT|nr:MAG: vitamin K epoxide reductase [Candidatus Kaiserbacteria bacterium CG10_big_fil_rev_8_21_14_0_10_49_17]
MHSRVLSVIALATFGIIDAGYLSWARFTGSSLSCNILNGCNVVAASPESVLFGIMPLSYLGLLFYIGIFALGVLLLVQDAKLFRVLLVLATLGGFLASVYFTYLQAFVINAFCIYCLTSAVLSTLLFGFSIWVYYTKEESPASVAEL